MPANSAESAPQPRSASEAQRLDEALRELFEHRITFNQVLGLRIESFDPDSPRIRLAMRPDLVGHYLYGRLHGGAIATLLDATAGLAVMCAIARKHCDESAQQVMHRFGRLGTIDLRIDFLRPGVGQWFDATARISRLGGRIASTQMTLTSDSGVLVATGAAAYIVS